MKKYWPFFLILAISVGTVGLTAWKSKLLKNQIVKKLPHYGNKTLQGKDTIYHTIAPFSFVNQLNKTITNASLENKNYLVEYFFTRCKSICPVMNENMMKIAKAFKNDTAFKILSHTVDPEHDDLAALLAYATEHNADPASWWFLTGDKEQLYHLARESYLLVNDEGKGDSADFIHSQLFVLVDNNRHIRGFYDGTADADIKKLIKDMVVLKHEQQVAQLKNFVKSMEITTGAKRKK